MDDFTPQQLFEADFFFQLKDNPEYASQAGQHEFDGKLQDLSPEAFELRQEHNSSVLKVAKSLMQRTCNKKDMLHLQLLVKNIEGEQKGFKMNCHLYPVNSIGYGGVHNNFIEALDWLGEENKAVNFLSRLAAFPQQVPSSMFWFLLCTASIFCSLSFICIRHSVSSTRICLNKA